MNISQLIQRRGAIKASLTRFCSFVDKCNNENIVDYITQLEIRLDNIYALLEQFSSVQSDIECFEYKSPDDAVAIKDKHGISDEANEKERSDFENKYYNIISQAKSLIQNFTTRNVTCKSPGHTGNSPNLHINSDVQFPVIELPKFYGDYQKWSQFQDMFLSLVHNDTRLDNIKKFYYLLSCVKGDAAKVIENIEVTNDNYIIAFNLLKSRYQNKYIIIKSHISALIDYPPINSKNCAEGLRTLTDDINKHTRSLKSLGEPVDSWDTILFHIIAKKLDPSSQREWESLLISSETNNKKFTLNDLTTFLEKRCILLETINREKHVEFNQQNLKKTKGSNFCGHASSKYVCNYCKSNKHEIFNCDQFKGLNIQARFNEIKKLKLCTNCLRSGHATFECKAQKCKRCNKHHNTLLHFEQVNNEHETHAKQRNTPEVIPHSHTDMDSMANTAMTSRYCNNNIQQVLLSTAVVLAKDSSDNWHEARVLLDSGSQPNFMTNKFANKLKLSYKEVSIPVIGVGNSSTSINRQVFATIKSINSMFKTKLPFLVLDRITDKLPSFSFDHKLFDLPKGIVLADPQFAISRDVDILLGANIFFSLIGSGQIQMGHGLPILHESKLGWIVSGNLSVLNSSLSENTVRCNLSTYQLSNKSLEKSIERFWKLEEIPFTQDFTEEEQYCEDLFTRTIKRAPSGHFIVRLPTRNNLNMLDSNLDNALKRFAAVEQKLKRSPKLHTLYSDFMDEYESLGHMIKINPETSQNGLDGTPIYYLPHHCIYNEQSDKFRVVFDGSSKSRSGLSLNDVLKVGPTIQTTLFDILLRFRGHSIVIVGDIEKMYRMVFVDETQRDLQRVVWRSSPDSEINHYQLATVTYGTNSAAFQAIRSLQQVGIENRSQYPNICEIIMNDFYVDDLVTGTDNINDAILLKNGLSDLLKKYGFKLRKWASNIPSLLDGCQADVLDHRIIEDEVRKTLGLIWKSNKDLLVYAVDDFVAQDTDPSKRNIFSFISKIFDPLGLVSPVTIKAKIMMQKLWELKISWDDPLPSEFCAAWNLFCHNLGALNNLKIPRHILLPNHTYIELHGFSDASQQAFSACIYIKSLTVDGTCQISLACSKTRVAPLKTVTVPRLELCGALLLARLYETVKKSVKFYINDVYLWSDSSIVLSWLASPPGTWKLFVANRVSEIQTLTKGANWRHVPTDSNPADLASRGIDPHLLEDQHLWWHGPDWLKSESDKWPKNLRYLNDNTLEKRNIQISMGTFIPDFDLFDRRSTLYRLQRVMSFCLRFINNIRNSPEKLKGKLTVKELDDSLKMLVKIAQAQSFHSDILSLKQTSFVNKTSRLKCLDPFLDADGVLRVGGRLGNSNLSYDNKHQMIICPKHPLTKLIILNEHHRQLHSGPQTLLVSLRERFWILNSRATVRSILRKCVTCFRVNPVKLMRKMGSLPSDRIIENRPFLIVGVDYAGPFNIKDGKLRNRCVIKAYLCIFICFTTKAVHLELVSDLSTQAFLNCFKRFISRRGVCRKIYSDNGLNFVGASNELKQLYSLLPTFVNNSDIMNYFLENRIEWHFIPPYSPHRGGLWEAAVKRAKFHFTRIVQKHILTFEDLTTVFAQIEAIINSRPLTPLSRDPGDLTALTPGHFLIGHPLTSIPQTDLKHVPANRLRQYQLLQQAVQQFWLNWSKDYLQTLQERSKWFKDSEDLVKEGALVLLVDDYLPPLHWKLGRILEVRKGSDGVVRTAIVRTVTGTTSRAVQKLCVLPIEADGQGKPSGIESA